MKDYIQNRITILTEKHAEYTQLIETEQNENTRNVYSSCAANIWDTIAELKKLLNIPEEFTELRPADGVTTI